MKPILFILLFLLVVACDDNTQDNKTEPTSLLNGNVWQRVIETTKTLGSGEIVVLRDTTTYHFEDLTVYYTTQLSLVDQSAGGYQVSQRTLTDEGVYELDAERKRLIITFPNPNIELLERWGEVTEEERVIKNDFEILILTRQKMVLKPISHKGSPKAASLAEQVYLPVTE